MLCPQVAATAPLHLTPICRYEIIWLMPVSLSTCHKNARPWILHQPAEPTRLQELEDVDVKFRYAHQVVEDQLRHLSLQNGKTPRLAHKGKAASFYKQCRDVRPSSCGSE